MNEHVGPKTFRINPPRPREPERRRFTGDEMEAMLRAGILHEEERVELIDGEIIALNAKGNRHEAVRSRLTSNWSKRVPDDLMVVAEPAFKLEAHNEPAYVGSVKEITDEFFNDVPAANLYLTKKTLRKILRFVNKQIKYSGIVQTEIELRVYFCTKIKEKRVPLTEGTVLSNLYQQQLKKIETSLAKLPEDLQADYQREIERIA